MLLNTDIICSIADYLDISTFINLKNTNSEIRSVFKNNNIYKQKLYKATIDIFDKLQYTTHYKLIISNDPHLKYSIIDSYNSLTLFITCPTFINLNTIKYMWES